MSRVEWSQSALDELASVWTQADSAMRQAITAERMHSTISFKTIQNNKESLETIWNGFFSRFR